jgi:alpha-L-fucosidase
MTRIIILTGFILLNSLICGAQQIDKKNPVPTPAQLEWHEQEFYLFVHFGPNTFTDKEWGHGDEHADMFNPAALDCRQWARVAKEAGAKAIIITAKHHDGFCLWPSKYSKHTVRESKWRNGKGDVLKDLSEACREYGLKFGVYISPWDRNHPKYGTDEYNDVFVNMMKEIFSNYGPIWELWWDGANGEGPNGKRQVYDWHRFKQTVKELSPNTVVFSDVGPHVRWIGNEKGIAGETNWNTLDTTGFTPGLGAPHVDTLNRGNMNGEAWIPGECDVSIRPGWFYHASEDDKVKTPEQLFDLYLKSVGRGANFLLNVPPDRRGQIHPNDSASLMEFRELLEKNFSDPYPYIAMSDGKEISGKLRDNDASSYIQLDAGNGLALGFADPVKINCIELRENLAQGQRAKSIRIQLMDGDKVLNEIQATTIGRKRLLTFPATTVKYIRIMIDEAKGPVLLGEVEVFWLEEKLISK